MSGVSDPQMQDPRRLPESEASCSRARTLDAFMRPPSDSPLNAVAAEPQAEAPDRAKALTPALAAARRRGAERGVIRSASAHPSVCRSVGAFGGRKPTKSCSF